jgi:hypothetical protein
VKTNPLDLTHKDFCSCYVPRETLVVQAIEPQRFSSTRRNFHPTQPPPQLLSCMTQKQHVLIDFLHENAEKYAMLINFRESDSIGD